MIQHISQQTSRFTYIDRTKVENTHLFNLNQPYTPLNFTGFKVCAFEGCNIAQHLPVKYLQCSHTGIFSIRPT